MIFDNIDLTDAQSKIIEEFEGEDDKFLNDLIQSIEIANSKQCQANSSNRDFLSKFYEGEDEGDDSTRANYGAEYEALASNQKETSYLLDKLNASSAFLNDLTKKYDSVAQKTSSLHEACDKLMLDQTSLTATAEEIRHRLTYFDKIDQISQKLQSPLLSVTGEAFLQILSSIDNAMLFLHCQSDYKESAAYLQKCKQCLAKALNRIKQHVYNLINKATDTVQAKFNASESKEKDDTFTLFYGLFGTYAHGIRSIMENLEQKREESEEYGSMLNDCYGYYFEKRNQLITPSITASIEQMKKSNSGSCMLVRSCCSFLLRLCDDEYHLYSKFFTLQTDLMHDYLENLSRLFYNAVRPVVIHAPHFETLAELCSILKYEILDERCNLDPDVYAGFVRVADELSGDATERLVYRAQIYARDDVRNFRPSAGDLAYPDKLQMMDAIGRALTSDQQQAQTQALQDTQGQAMARQTSTSSVVSAASQEVASINSAHSLTAADLHGLWYPTVKRAVLCLSKLFRCLDSTVFQGISEDILSMCIDSLHFASEKISSNKGCANGELFVIKHLLILREQTTPFRGSCSVKEASVDLWKIKDSAWNFFNQKSRWFSVTNNAFLELLLQSPANVVDHVIDSRRILDLQLRDACQNFIGHCSKELTKELSEFIDQAQPFLAHDKPSASKLLKQQPFASQKILQERVSEAYKKLRNNVPTWKALLSIYLSNKETENIIFTPIKRNAEQSFNRFREIVDKNYGADEAQVIACPSTEEVSMLLA